MSSRDIKRVNSASTAKVFPEGGEKSQSRNNSLNSLRNSSKSSRLELKVERRNPDTDREIQYSKQLIRKITENSISTRSKQPVLISSKNNVAQAKPKQHHRRSTSSGDYSQSGSDSERSHSDHEKKPSPLRLSHNPPMSEDEHSRSSKHESSLSESESENDSVEVSQKRDRYSKQLIRKITEGNIHVNVSKKGSEAKITIRKSSIDNGEHNGSNDLPLTKSGNSNEVLQSIPEIFVVHGELQKRGRILKSIIRRWCVLEGNKFSYYKKRGDLTPKNSYTLRDIVAVKEAGIDETKLQNSFCVLTKSRTFVFGAPDNISKSRWLGGFELISPKK